MAAALVLALPDGRAGATAQPADVRSFSSLGHGDAKARGMYGTLRYEFPVPFGQLPQQGARIDLVVSHSALLVPDRSTMTVFVGGRPVASHFLAAESRDRGRYSAPLPPDGVVGDRYRVEVHFRLRLTRDGCEDPHDPALWATVHGDSTLILPTAPSAEAPDLRNLSRLLVRETPAGETAPLTLTLPEGDRSPESLRAAGLVAFQYGRWAGRANGDAAVSVSTSPPSGPGAAVLVGRGAALVLREPIGSLRWDDAAFAGADGPVPSDVGVIGLTRSSPLTLVVSGATPAAVLTAAEALVQPERRDALAGGHALVTGESPAWVDGGRPWRGGAASFAQLRAEREMVTGPGLHAVRFAFERPPGWVLDNDGTLELAVERTGAVRAETSWVAARLNGIDLGARPLDAASGQPGRYRFALPADRLNADLSGQPLRALMLEVQLYLDVPRAGCPDAPADGAGAAILPSSAWRLPHREYPGLDLGRFPAMLFDDRAPIAVVIPDGADEEELAAGLTVMAALGRWSGSDDATWPRLIRADALTDRERRASHLVLIGGPDDNRLSDEARRRNRALFPDEAPPLIGVDDQGRALWGRLQLARSPWGRGRVVVTLDGSDLAGLRFAAASLAGADSLAQVRGRLVVLSPGLPPQVLLGAEPPERPPGDLAPRATRPFRDRIAPWQIAGATLLSGFAIAVAAVLAWRGRRA